MQGGIARQIFHRLAQVDSLLGLPVVCRHLPIKARAPAMFAALKVCLTQPRLVGRLCVWHGGHASNVIVISQRLVQKVGRPSMGSRDAVRRQEIMLVLVLMWQSLMGSMPRCCRSGLRLAVHFGSASSEVGSEQFQGVKR